ncbi:hypothetical protein ASALC70_01125 [Alcanivorax sp. ALC70]|nr:hypothetical protein ASALC70_01125 [Alcanivorax sp. ALC70]
MEIGKSVYRPLDTPARIEEQLDLVGAVGGAVIGGVLGAIFGNSGTAGRMAGDAQQEKEQVLKNCMRGRGYRVLN